MSTCMQCSQIIARPNGPKLLLSAVAIAVRACRSDIETECAEVHDLGHRWWDTEGGLFVGGGENDLEFLQMRRDAVEFLDGMDQLIRHPDQPAWVRFPVEEEPAEVDQPEAVTA